jgi:retron-type reverse transcriptase
VRSGESLIPKDTDLLELMLCRENMTSAWKRVKANRGAQGVDGLSINETEIEIRETWNSIKGRIEDGSYTPSPVRRTEIPKGNGETRPLGIPTVLDRLIQQALAQVLVQIFDPSFSKQSFGFRPHRVLPIAGSTSSQKPTILKFLQVFLDNSRATILQEPLLNV